VIESLIATYGYLAVLLGTLAEGETALVGGGYAAHRGWLQLTPTLVAAFAGAFGGDQLFFYVGRRHGRQFFGKRPLWSPHVDRLNSLVERHETAVVISFRFLYGLRFATPIALGMGTVAYPKYLALTLASGIVWTLLFGLGGYFLGEAMQRVLGDIEQVELYGLFAILLVGIVVLSVRAVRQRRQRQRQRQRLTSQQEVQQQPHD